MIAERANWTRTAYEVEVVDVEPTIIASVRQRGPWSDLPRLVPRLLGEVWTFVKSGAVSKRGHNVAIYRDPDAKDIEVECGVQVSGIFGDSERVRRPETPSRRAAHAIHIGQYGDMRKAYDAIKAFCAERGMEAGVHREVYGDWNEDPAQLRTDVFGLIR